MNTCYIILYYIKNFYIAWRRDWQPTPEFLNGESHGQRSLTGYGPWGRKVSDMTEQLTFYTAIRRIQTSAKNQRKK